MINTYANVMRLAKELEQEQISHAETRKLLLETCEKRDAQRIDDYRAGYSCGFNDHLLSRGIRDQEAAEKYFGITHSTPAPVAPEPCGFYGALDKHVRDGVIAAAVDIGRHHQELIRLDESRTDEKLLQAIAAADADADARDEGDTRDEESLEDHNIQGLGAFRDVFDADGEQ